MADRAEVPISPEISEIGMSPENPDLAVPMTPPDVFHVGVINAIFELAKEFHIIDTLACKVRRVEVKPEPPMMFYRVQGPMSGCDIKGDLRRMHFETEIDVDGIKRIQYGQKSSGKIIIPLLEKLLACRRESVTCMPDAGPGKSGNHSWKLGALVRLGINEIARRARCLDHMFSGAPAYAFRIAIFPDLRRQNLSMPSIDIVADSLPDKMIGNCKSG